MKEAYLRYYIPLVQQFCAELQQCGVSDFGDLPEPFLPLFGTGYEKSALKLMIVGQDSRDWGHMSSFVAEELAAPGSVMEQRFANVEGLHFRNWGKSTHSFFGFVMALLASAHGMPDWNVLKRGSGDDVLSSFAWGNANSVVLRETVQKNGFTVSEDAWQAARTASAGLNKLRHVLEVLKPRVVVVTYQGLNLNDYFDGLSWRKMKPEAEGLDHYRIESPLVDIICTRHPSSMRWAGGPWEFLNRIRSALLNLGLAPDFPEFVDTNSGDAVIDFIIETAPRPGLNDNDKYHLVGWIAQELGKRGAFMSVPCLARLTNDLGYRTNRGTMYSGGRGTYRLVRGAYYRFQQAGDQETAENIAFSFRKPDFSYAYN